MKFKFTKMHGLGNDFIIIDNRKQHFITDTALIKQLSNRKTGIGCDQFIVIEATHDPLADISLRIFNADGCEVPTCGNASRAIVAFLYQTDNKKHILIETKGGLVDGTYIDAHQIAVDMGIVKLDWRDIPVAKALDPKHIRFDTYSGCAVNVGNPHIAFCVDDLNTIDLTIFGPKIETNALFPLGVNVELYQVVSPHEINMRVWERGVGITEACGSGACAVAIASHLTQSTHRQVQVNMPGGTLHIHWQKDNHVIMIGPAVFVFTGEIVI